MLLELTLLLATHRQSGGLEVKWTETTRGAWNLSTDGTNVYALSTKGVLKVYRGDDGQVIAERQIGTEAGGIITKPDGTCFAFADSHLLKLKKDLSTEWVSSGIVSYWPWGTGMAISEDGTIAISAGRGLQFCTADGKSDEKATFVGAGSFNSDPVFIDKSTVAFLGNNLAVLKYPERKTTWMFKSGPTGASPVVSNGSLFVCASDTVFKLDAKTGRNAWRIGLGATGYTPAVTRSAVVVPTTRGIFGLSAIDGRLGWSNSVHANSHAVLVGEKSVVVLARGGMSLSQVVALLIDPMTGSILSTSPAISMDGSTGDTPLISVGTNSVAGFSNGTLFYLTVR